MKLILDEIEFDELNHRYIYKGVTYPSVSEISRNTNKSAEPFMTDALQGGNLVHQEMARFVSTGEYSEGVLEGNYAVKLAKLIEMLGWVCKQGLIDLEFCETERPFVYLNEHTGVNYAGTTDLVDLYNNVILDYKTGNKMSFWKLQLSAYANAFACKKAIALWFKNHDVAIEEVNGFIPEDGYIVEKGGNTYLRRVLPAITEYGEDYEILTVFDGGVYKQEFFQGDNKKTGYGLNYGFKKFTSNYNKLKNPNNEKNKCNLLGLLQAHDEAKYEYKDEKEFNINNYNYGDELNVNYDYNYNYGGDVDDDDDDEWMESCFQDH